MERRPLDFNAPLLSARRYTSPRSSSELIRWEWESEDITKPASVPFNWEQTPGRPKHEPETRPGRFNSGEIPRLPPARQSRYLSGDRSNDHNTTICSDHALLLQKLNDSSEEEEEYAYSLNTISLTETWSDSKQRPSGKFCVDKQTRDFMMSRFLPAAKAAVLETPKNKVIREKPKEVRRVISEKPKEVRKVFSGEMLTKSLIMKQYGSDGLPSYFRHPDFDNVGSEEDEEHSIVVPVKKSGRSSWGINLPRICVNLKNPLPSMMSKSRPQSPSHVEERRFRRNSVSGPLDKTGSEVPPKKKYHSGLISNSKSSSNEVNQQLLNPPNRTGISPLRRYRSGNNNISPHRTESPKSAFREGAGFLGPPNISNKEDASKIASSRRMFRALQEVSRTNQVNEAGPLEEKVVYVDSMCRRAVNSKYSDDVKMYESFGQESKCMGLRSKDSQLEIKGGDELLNSYIGGECDDLPLKSRGVGLHKKDVKHEIKLKGECDDLPLKLSMPPPLPISPSESWLWRNLPPIPLGNQSARNSQIHSKKQGRKDDTKWETIVKTSNERHDHTCYSVEHTPHLPYLHT